MSDRAKSIGLIALLWVIQCGFVPVIWVVSQLNEMFGHGHWLLVFAWAGAAFSVGYASHLTWQFITDEARK